LGDKASVKICRQQIYRSEGEGKRIKKAESKRLQKALEPIDKSRHKGEAVQESKKAWKKWRKNIMVGKKVGGLAVLK